MAVRLRPQSGADPLEISREQYDQLVTKSEGGWSRCAEETEWLAKLHYLREGFKMGKLEPAAFEEREARLVTDWLIKLTR